MLRLGTMLLKRGFKEVNPQRKDKGPTNNTWFNINSKIKVKRTIEGLGKRRILITQSGKVVREFNLPEQEDKARDYILENL